MSRRSFFLAVAIFLFLTCGATSTLCVLVRYEPHLYKQAVVPPGPTRTQLSREFSDEFCRLISDISGDHDLYAHFTDEQINSYFEEGFVHSGLAERLLPEGISQPRLIIEPGKIRLGFRYGTGFWSTIISIDMRVWLPENEPNVVGLKLEGFHAGALPIAAQSLLERVSEVGRQNGVDVSWYRFEGHPTALLRFQPEQPRPTLQLQAILLEQGAITIQGKTNESSSLHSQVQLPSSEEKVTR